METIFTMHYDRVTMGLTEWLVCPECESDNCDYGPADPSNGSLKLECEDCGHTEWVM